MLTMGPTAFREHGNVPADGASQDGTSGKRSLASILRDHGPLPASVAVDIALDVCDALASAHANGVIHGDVGLHRVRTVWPRPHAMCGVDIFALQETDTAAFAFRKSAHSIMVAPEQRAGRKVDVRADVWAIGVLLHWMITGVAPSSHAVGRNQLVAPRALVSTIEACLSDDPDRRPASCDDLASAIGSFAASPPARFEQLALRRTAQRNARLVRNDASDLERVLGRLDNLADERERAAAAELAREHAAALERAKGALRKMASAPPPPMLNLGDDEVDAETIAIHRVPTLAPPPDQVQSTQPLRRMTAASLSAIVLPAFSETPPPPYAYYVHTPAPPLAAPVGAMLAERRSTFWTMLGVFGAAAVIVFAIGFSMHRMDRGASAASGRPPAPTQIEPRSAPSAPSSAPASVAIVSPSSLPDAPAKARTPAAREPAKPAPAPVRRARPSRPAASASAPLAPSASGKSDVPAAEEPASPGPAEEPTVAPPSTLADPLSIPQH